MIIRFAILPLFLALNLSMCKKEENASSSSQQASASSATPVATPLAAASPKVTKPVVDQTAQVLIFCYHRLVDKIRYPGTEITPAAFEAEMKELGSRHYSHFNAGFARLEEGRKEYTTALCGRYFR